MKPWADKALAVSLKFATFKNTFIIQGGTLYGATLNRFIIIDGPVRLVNCQLNGCAITSNGIKQAYFENCKAVGNSVAMVNFNKFSASPTIGGYNWMDILVDKSEIYATPETGIITVYNTTSLNGPAQNNLSSTGSDAYLKGL
jgi:hypothetical protein